MLTPPPSFISACQTIGLSLEDREIEQLGQFLELLLETNKQFNLTAIKEPEQAWHRHILDSLSILPFLGDAQTVIDVGSGGGLPGIPLAIVKPEMQWTLLEATGKKANFIKQAAKELGLDHVTVINDRAETVGHDAVYRQKFELAVCRAVGPMNVLLEYLLPLVKTGGRVLAMKGKQIVDELENAGDALMTLGGGNIELYEALPGLEDDAVIVEVEKIAPTPRTYPRRPGEPKRKPL